MEGPSLFLAAEVLAPLIHQKIIKVSGNTKTSKERLLDQEILNIFSWGKHLVFQFKDFALRVHFMLYGTFEAKIGKKKVTGDYEKTQIPRLSLSLQKGEIALFNCSLLFIENSDAKSLYDFSVDVMSEDWDAKKALAKVLKEPEREIGDVLLDQSIFAGVGNIIKNEVLFLEKIHPSQTLNKLSRSKIKDLIQRVREFCFQFYNWRKEFVLKKHLQIYRKAYCPNCQTKAVRKKTGQRQRLSYFCPSCQKL